LKENPSREFLSRDFKEKGEKSVFKDVKKEVLKENPGPHHILRG